MLTLGKKSNQKKVPEDIKQPLKDIDIMVENPNSLEFTFANKFFKNADIDLRIGSLQYRFEEIKSNFANKYQLTRHQQIISIEPIDDTLNKLKLYKTLVNELHCKDANLTILNQNLLIPLAAQMLSGKFCLVKDARMLSDMPKINAYNLFEAMKFHVDEVLRHSKKLIKEYNSKSDISKKLLLLKYMSVIKDYTGHIHNFDYNPLFADKKNYEIFSEGLESQENYYALERSVAIKFSNQIHYSIKSNRLTSFEIFQQEARLLLKHSECPSYEYQTIYEYCSILEENCNGSSEIFKCSSWEFIKYDFYSKIARFQYEADYYCQKKDALYTYVYYMHIELQRSYECLINHKEKIGDRLFSEQKVFEKEFKDLEDSFTAAEERLEGLREYLNAGAILCDCGYMFEKTWRRVKDTMAFTYNYFFSPSQRGNEGLHLKHISIMQIENNYLKSQCQGMLKYEAERRRSYDALKRTNCVQSDDIELVTKKLEALELEKKSVDDKLSEGEQKTETLLEQKKQEVEQAQKQVKALDEEVFILKANLKSEQANASLDINTLTEKVEKLELNDKTTNAELIKTQNAHQSVVNSIIKLRESKKTSKIELEDLLKTTNQQNCQIEAYSQENKELKRRLLEEVLSMQQKRKITAQRMPRFFKQPVISSVNLDKSYREDVLWVLNELNKRRGTYALLHGGAIRDLPHKPFDFDIKTNASVLEIKELFKRYNPKQNRRHTNVVHLRYAGLLFDIQSISMPLEQLNLEELRSKNDFTVNTLLGWPCNNDDGDLYLFDPHQCFEDILSRRLRFMEPISQAIAESPIQTLRLVRRLAHRQHPFNMNEDDYTEVAKYSSALAKVDLCLILSNLQHAFRDADFRHALEHIFNLNISQAIYKISKQSLAEYLNKSKDIEFFYNTVIFNIESGDYAKDILNYYSQDAGCLGKSFVHCLTINTYASIMLHLYITATVFGEESHKILEKYISSWNTLTPSKELDKIQKSFSYHAKFIDYIFKLLKKDPPFLSSPPFEYDNDEIEPSVYLPLFNSNMTNHGFVSHCTPNSIAQSGSKVLKHLSH